MLLSGAAPSRSAPKIVKPGDQRAESGTTVRTVTELSVAQYRLVLARRAKAIHKTATGKGTSMSDDAAIGAVRKAISDIGHASDMHSLENLVRVADDLLIDFWSSGLVDEEDLPDLRLELALARRKRLEQLNP